MLPVNGSRLIDLIPQKLPFVLVSTLEEVTENMCRTSFEFTDDHVLCTNGELTPGGLMENMAQTCAAKMGYECFLANKKIPVGFIGDVRDFTFLKLPKAGDKIMTEINIVHRIFDVTMIKARVMLHGAEISSCSMKIFVEPENKPAA